MKWSEAKSLSHVRLFAIPWTVAYQAPLSMEFSRQEYWSGLPFSSPGDLPDRGIKPGSPALQADALPSELPGKPYVMLLHTIMLKGFPGVSDHKESACNVGDPGSIPGSGKSPGEENGSPLQYFCLENPVDRGACPWVAHKRIRHDWRNLAHMHVNRANTLLSGLTFLTSIYSCHKTR